MKKYLLISLLFGFIFGQTDQSKDFLGNEEYMLQKEAHFYDLLEFDKVWKPKYKRLNEIRLEFDEISELLESVKKVADPNDFLFMTILSEDCLEVRMKADWYKDLTFLFHFTRRLYNKEYIVNNIKEINRRIEGNIERVMMYSNFIDNSQGVFVANKYLELCKEFKKETQKINDILDLEYQKNKEKYNILNFIKPDGKNR